MKGLCAGLLAFTALLLASWSGGASAGAAAVANMPVKLQGHWQVVQVAVDEWDQPHWSLYPNDPRFLGRLLTIERLTFQLDDGSPACKNPKYTAMATQALQRFIGKNYRRPPAPQMPSLPTLKNFGLHLPDAAVTPWRLGCTPHSSHWSFFAPTWLVLTGDRLLIGKRGTEYILVLRRVNQRAPIRASFNCAKATTVVEKTICGSRTLAAYDRSVAAAYRGALQVAGGGEGALHVAQRKWLKQRDACGTNVACLEQSMRQRVDDLMQQW